MIEPTPTKRFVIDPIRNCTTKCKFCYYLHSYDNWSSHTWPLEQTKSCIDSGLGRGNNYADFTGGEPTIYPYINESIEYALSLGIKSCIITNGITAKDKIDSIMSSGLDDWLVSRHGLKDTHNFLVNRPDAYDKQVKFLENVCRNMRVRFNCVINKFNQTEIFEIAKELSVFNPRIVNFINMNPHHEWRDKSLAVQDVIADLRVVEPLLNSSISFLESKSIGVNIRYYPMCRVARDYRRTISNDLHVVFDPYEWDYQINPKTFESHKKWGLDTSNVVEEKSEPCCSCGLHSICGGANKHWHTASNQIYGELLLPQAPEVESDFYFYRQHNRLTL